MNALPSFNDSVVMNSLQTAFATQASQPNARQRQAWETFVKQGLPTIRDEQWKYTNLQRLSGSAFAIANPVSNVEIQRSVEYDAIIIANGQMLATQVLPTHPGLRISIDAAPTETAGNALFALNSALNQSPLLLELADNVVLERPLCLTFMIVASTSSMTHPRVTIRLGRNSKLTLLERYTGEGDVTHFTNSVTHIELAEGATLEHCRLQYDNAASFHIGMLSAHLESRARYINHQYNLGAALSRVDINVMLDGGAAHAELNGLQFAIDTQHHDTHTRVEHCVPHASSAETYHGIADGRGRVVFNGKVMVHNHAIGTDAKQSSRNLLLSPKAEIDTKPELEIYADDVKCAHGATVGQLDSDALFYLRSRGIDEKQARALLTVAFADTVINRVPIQSLRDELTRLVHARFSETSELAS